MPNYHVPSAPFHFLLVPTPSSLLQDVLCFYSVVMLSCNGSHLHINTVALSVCVHKTLTFWIKCLIFLYSMLLPSLSIGFVYPCNRLRFLS